MNVTHPIPGYRLWYDGERFRWARESYSDHVPDTTYGHGSAPTQEQALQACMAHAETVKYLRSQVRKSA